MSLVSERIGQFFFEEFRLEYTEFGAGDRWVVLVPGQLLPRRMHQPLARRLAALGHHVLTVDLLGQGRSDRPADPTAYSLPAFADQLLALLDEQGIDAAVVGGTSLGANIALQLAVSQPRRVRGVLAEMPVLDNALVAQILVASPLFLAGRGLPFLVRGVRRAGELVPRGLVPFWAGIGLDALRQQPAAMAANVHGVLFGPLAPTTADRSRIVAPTIVVGHRLDPLHPAADAEMLAEEIPGAELIWARSAWEWRSRPDRIDGLVAAFLEECFAAVPATRRRLRASVRPTTQGE